MPSAIVSLKNLSLSYAGNRPVLKNLNWQIQTGEWWGICGSNGSGKTSLLYCLAGLVPRLIPGRLSGEISISQSAGIVFQNPDFSLFNLTVEEEVAFGHNHSVEPALKAVGLWHERQTDPQTLSYGTKQKICLAAVLARDPEIILLDEPTSMLDYKSSVNLYGILKKLNLAGKTIVVVEHHTDLLAAYAQKTLIIEQGKIVAQGQTRAVFKKQALIKRLGLKPVR